jgi:hypothetical protein
MQTKNINNNSTDMFVAFTMVQQIITELLGAATEKEKAADITKTMFKLLKNNAINNSYTSEN